MKTFILGLAGAAAALVAAAPAQAQYGYGDRYRDHRQEQRIYHGARRGEITPREYYRLQRQQNRIDRFRSHARYDDGHLSWRERQRLHQMRNRASRNIYRQRHDWQGRGYDRY